MANQFVVKDIPGSEVDGVVQGYVADGCKPVEKIQQSDGNWTVKATCPDA
jgi:hypothetical protein